MDAAAAIKTALLADTSVTDILGTRIYDFEADNIVTAGIKSSNNDISGAFSSGRMQPIAVVKNVTKSGVAYGDETLLHVRVPVAIYLYQKDGTDVIKNAESAIMDSLNGRIISGTGQVTARPDRIPYTDPAVGDAAVIQILFDVNGAI